MIVMVTAGLRGIETSSLEVFTGDCVLMEALLFYAVIEKKKLCLKELRICFNMLLEKLAIRNG